MATSALRAVSLAFFVYQKEAQPVDLAMAPPFPDYDTAALYVDSGHMLVRPILVYSEVHVLQGRSSIRNHTACSGMTRWTRILEGHWPISGDTRYSQSTMIQNQHNERTRLACEMAAEAGVSYLEVPM